MADWIQPKFGSVGLVFGPGRMGVLNALNISKQNCALHCSVT